MKRNILLLILLIIGSCKDESFKPPNFCPTCTSSVTINGINWPSKVSYAFFDINEQIDTFFAVDIRESISMHDPINDELLLYRIPFEQGDYKLNNAIHSEWKTDITLFVLEEEYGTPTDLYLPIYDGASEINVEYINKLTGEFSLAFNTVLFPVGNPDIEPHNSTYPKMVQFNGSVQGIITYH